LSALPEAEPEEEGKEVQEVAIKRIENDVMQRRSTKASLTKASLDKTMPGEAGEEGKTKKVVSKHQLQQKEEKEDYENGSPTTTTTTTTSTDGSAADTNINNNDSNNIFNNIFNNNNNNNNGYYNNDADEYIAWMTWMKETIEYYTNIIFTRIPPNIIARASPATLTVQQIQQYIIYLIETSSTYYNNTVNTVLNSVDNINTWYNSGRMNTDITNYVQTTYQQIIVVVGTMYKNNDTFKTILFHVELYLLWILTNVGSWVVLFFATFTTSSSTTVEGTVSSSSSSNTIDAINKEEELVIASKSIIVNDESSLLLAPAPDR
jgi:hypothetical protein